MSLCMGVHGEDFALVASDCYSGRQPSQSAELAGRVASLPNGWLTYTSLDDAASKMVAGTLELEGRAAYRPRQLANRIGGMYSGEVPSHRGRRVGPDTEGCGFEAAFYVACLGPRGYDVWLLFSDGVGKTLKTRQAHVSPPPDMSEALEARRESGVLADYLATAPDVWTAVKRAGEVQREVREGTPYVSRHMHVCAVAAADDRPAKLAKLYDSDRLADLSPAEIAEEMVRFEGVMSAEMLRERERQKKAAATEEALADKEEAIAEALEERGV